MQGRPAAAASGALLLLLPASARGGVRCPAARSTSLVISFDAVAGSDWHQIQLLRDPSDTAHPYLVQTVPQGTASTVLWDLKPSVTYHLQLLPHNASAPSVVQGWGEPAASVACETASLRPGAPFALDRAENRANKGRLSLRWRLPGDGAGGGQSPHRREPDSGQAAPTLLAPPTPTLLLRRCADQLCADRHQPGVSDASVEWRCVKGVVDHDGDAAGSVATAVVADLAPGAYEVVAQAASLGDGGGACARGGVGGGGATAGDPEMFRVAGNATVPTEIFRVSEYTYEVDFLANHNSADLEGQVAFLTSTNDNLFFQMSKSPVARYCVERLPYNPGWEGYADYVSCNGPEADPYNHPADPICICDVFPDRMIALQTKATMDAACGPIAWSPDGTHSAPVCNCTNAAGNTSKWVTSNASDWHVGAMPTWLPYFYFQVPSPTYPGSARFGINFATPRKGQCAQDGAVGDGGCTWRRAPSAHVVWGSELLALGWNRTNVNHWPLRRHGPNTTEQILTNLPVFKRAYGALSTLVTPRCCGC